MLTDTDPDLVAHGLSNDEIAGRLAVTATTAKTRVNRAMVKLGAHDRAQLVIAAYQAGLARPTARDRHASGVPEADERRERSTSSAPRVASTTTPIRIHTHAGTPPLELEPLTCAAGTTLLGDGVALLLAAVLDVVGAVKVKCTAP